MVNIHLFMAVRAELVLSLWNRSGLGTEPKSPALAGRFCLYHQGSPLLFIFSCHFVVSVAIRLTKFFLL